MQLMETPVVRWLTSVVERRRWDLLKLVRMPVWMEAALAVLFIDYGLYVWHILMHRIPPFWRFHLAITRTLTWTLPPPFGSILESCSSQFHGAPCRSCRSGLAARVFSSAEPVLLEIMFHHSGVELPVEVERRLAWRVVTPCMHGIHNSIVRAETESNWASVLSI